MSILQYSPRQYVLDTLANLPANDQCTPWPFCLNSRGFAFVSDNKETIAAHCFAYFATYGRPRGKFRIGHTCKTKFCFRPNHLRFIVNRWQYLVETLAALPDGDECVEWPFSRNSDGYGCIKGYSRVHCAAYAITYGLPSGISVLHKCDNPPCFRPSHLFLGSQADNVADCIGKGRNRTAPPLGSEHGNAILTEDMVREMRQKYDSGISRRQLAEQYNTVKTNVDLIVTRKAWRHV